MDIKRITGVFVGLLVLSNLNPLTYQAIAQDGATRPGQDPIRQGPRVLRGGDHGVGRMLPNVSFVDPAGRQHKLGDLSQDSPLVIAMTSTSCPLSSKYLPTLVELVSRSHGKVEWLVVNPIATDEAEDITAAAGKFDGNAMYIHDRDGHLAEQVGALTTTDVIVIDGSRTVLYHGAIDDQYGFGYAIDSPRQHYLADALTAITAGRQPAVTATDAPGCTLHHSASRTSAEVTSATWHNRISRIMQQHCIECHRTDGVAPFSLMTFADVSAHAGMIEQVVQRGIMPPWFAEEGPASENDNATHSPWANDRSLAAAEKQDLLKWLTNGRPEGDPDDAPLPRRFEDGWLIGKPDVVYQFADPVPVKAMGVMPYQNLVVETDLPEARWVQAIEVKPGNRAVVHHVLVFAVGTGAEASDERDGYWGIYVPGNSTLVYPDGFAKRLPKKAQLRFQMHYTPNGTATTDQTSIGLIFSKTPPQHEVRVAGIVNSKIKIPAGAANHREEAKLAISSDAVVLGFLPHMHVRGKACRYELTTAAGDTTTLLDIPRYDFNWQLLYRYQKPLSLPAGVTLKFIGWYDNSSSNPANPDPTKAIRWGPQTFDEMLLGYVEYYVPGATPGAPGSRVMKAGQSETRQRRNAALFIRLDVNKDGHITKEEVRERMPNDPRAAGPIFDRLDENQNGRLTKSELQKL